MIPKTEVLTQNSIQTSFVWDVCQSYDKKKVYVSSLQEGLLCFDENGKFLQSYKVSSDVNSSDSYKINCVLDVEGGSMAGSRQQFVGEVEPADRNG
mgnify:CR=1 FL=1